MRGVMVGMNTASAANLFVILIEMAGHFDFTTLACYTTCVNRLLYSQTCLERPPLSHSESGHKTQVALKGN